VLPDKTLAREIRQRGTDFKVDRPVLNHFSEIGAGAETMKSLAEALTTADLVIFTVPPGCEVSIDSHAIGRSDDTGKLVVSDLNEGPSQLRISKDGYRRRSYDVTLTRNKVAELRTTLERAIGYLSVSTDPPDASVVVTPSDLVLELRGPDLCKYSPSQGRALECVPADYIVWASRDGYRPSSKTVRILDGQTTGVSFTLACEPSAADSAPGRTKETSPLGAPTPGGTERTKDTGAIRLLAMVQTAMGGSGNLASVRDWQQRAREIWLPGRGTTEMTTTFATPSSLREDSSGGNRTCTSGKSA